MPRTTILQVIDSNGNVVYPDPSIPPGEADRGHQPPGRLHHHRHPRRQHEPQGQPVLGRVGGLRRPDPPAGRLQDRHDERQPRRRTRTASSPRPRTRTLPGPRGRRLDGQQQQRAQHRHAVARVVGAALVADHARRQQGPADRGLAPPDGARRGDGRRVQRHEARAVQHEDGRPSCSSRAPRPSDTDDFHRAVTIDTASGLLWQDGCVGPKKTVGALDFSSVEAIGKWGYYDRGWPKRASKGSGVRGGPEGTRTAYFYGSGFFPFGRTWGGIFAPTELCPLAGAAAADLRRSRSCPTARPTRPPPGQPTPKTRARRRSRSDPRAAQSVRRSTLRRRPRLARRPGPTSRAGGSRPPTGPRRAARRSRGRG